MASSPLLDVILVTCADKPITAYDPSSGTTLASFNSTLSSCQGLTLVGEAFLATSHLSQTTGSGSIYLYNWGSPNVLHNLPVPEPVAPLSATSDGLYVFAGGLSGTVHALSVPSGYVINSLSAHKNSISCLEISRDGSFLVSGSDDGSIAVTPIVQLLDAENSSIGKVHHFVAHAGPVTTVACAKVCNMIVISCSLDRTCKFWGLLNGTHHGTITFPCPILRVTLDPLELNFYAAGTDGFIYKGSVMSGFQQRVNQGKNFVTWGDQHHNGSVVSVVMMNEGQNLVSATEDGSVWIWQVESGQVLTVLGNKMGAITDLRVARGIRIVGSTRVRGSIGSNEFLVRQFSSSGRELHKPVEELVELEDVLKMVDDDKRRAISMLESAIEGYEKLLEMILKEAREGTRSFNENAKDAE